MSNPSIIEQLVTPYANHQILFNEPVVVKNNETSIFECWGIASHEGIWLMDEQGLWYKWQANDRNAGLVMESIEDRLHVLKILNRYDRKVANRQD